jgi:hypothetical protein
VQFLGGFVRAGSRFCLRFVIQSCNASCDPGESSRFLLYVDHTFIGTPPVGAVVGFGDE